jgi:hypothetical protein
MSPVAEPPTTSAPTGREQLVKPIVLRCWVYRRSTYDWIAECIDLDMVVRARTPEVAANRLQDAMISHITVTVTGGDMAGLLPRPSPWSHRIRYHLCRLLSRFKVTNRYRLFDCQSHPCPC